MKDERREWWTELDRGAGVLGLASSEDVAELWGAQDRKEAVEDRSDIISST